MTNDIYIIYASSCNSFFSRFVSLYFHLCCFFYPFLRKMHDTKINACICELYLPLFFSYIHTHTHTYTGISATYTLNHIYSLTFFFIFTKYHKNHTSLCSQQKTKLLKSCQNDTSSIRSASRPLAFDNINNIYFNTVLMQLHVLVEKHVPYIIIFGSDSRNSRDRREIVYSKYIYKFRIALGISKRTKC